MADPPPEALVVGLGSAGVDMVARFWIDPPRRREAVDALDGAIEAVKLALTEAGIDLPYPTSQLLFHDQTEETDGDRARQREGWPAKRHGVPRPRWEVLRGEAAAPDPVAATRDGQDQSPGWTAASPEQDR